MSQRVLALDPAAYERHRLHQNPDRLWAETNCYVDVWIELLHALGHEPLAAMPFTFGIDFEGDQWTFFKFPLADLERLYGIEVQELALWRPLVAHLEEQLGRGRPVLVELDSFHLPDTAGTAYRLGHVKSTVAAVAIDADARRLGYFHGQSYYELEGDDFLDVLRVREPRDSAHLPPYAEFVKLHRPPVEDTCDLAAASRELLGEHLRKLPSENPFPCFKERLARDLSGLLDEDIDAFHQYSFATLRQFGACYELSAAYLDWLSAQGEADLEKSARAFRDLAEGAKTFQFQLARAMARRKPLDLSALDTMAGRWECGISTLQARFC
jgi:hypothetical protein